MVSVEKADWLPPTRVAVEGNTFALTPLGTPTVLKFTVPMKLLTPETWTDENVVSPGVRVRNWGKTLMKKADTERVKVTA